VQIKSFGEGHLVRLERGEKVIASLRRFAKRYRIGFAAFRAIGTLDQVTLGYYDSDSQAYRNQALDEAVEVLNLSGNISRGADGEHIVHAHVTVGGPDYTALGGHVVEATVGPTLELVVDTWPTSVQRRHDPDTGLDLWDLDAVKTRPV
jgi:predicted DNA-binding protein with PD1-like motif